MCTRIDVGRVCSSSQRCVLAIAVSLTLSGCWRGADQEVVVYSALDREFSEPLLRQFEANTGIRVLTKFDVESTKTVGLVQEILRERERPRCDLFWNNEILHTLRLEREGLLAPCPPPAAAGFPANYRSAAGTWTGFACRARVLLVNTQLMPPEAQPRSLLDLADPQWRGRVGLAKPLFGTTATHAAVLWAAWGSTRAEQFFRELKANAQILSGNKQVAQAVGRGQLAFGLTDTDDAIIELREQARPVAIVYPDQGPGELGTLFIPNTLCLIQGAPHQAASRRLLDFLLSAEVESQLATGRSAQFPVNPRVMIRSAAAPEQPVRWMEADFVAAAAVWDEATGVLRSVFAE